MIHPLFKKKLYLIIYFSTWVPLWLITVSVIFLNGFANLPTAFLSGFIHVAVYAIIGIGLWYVTLYSNINDNDFSSLIISHISLALVVTVLWILISEFLISVFTTFWPIGIIEHKITYAGRALVGVIYYAILTMFYYASRYYNESKTNKVNEERLRAMLREAELNALKAQVNPHFLFNSLNSISMLTLSEPTHAREMLVKLSEYIRYALKQNNSNHSSCRDELENCKKYLEIEKIRFGEKLVAEFDVSEHCKEIQIPVMILQPLYENAVKHGVYESITPISIKTKIVQHSDHILIRIENEFDPEAIPRKGEGIGMKNVQERLKLEYKRHDLFHFLKLENIFIVELTIPNTREQ